MMKYAAPEIKPYHFITEIETTDSTVARYVRDATLVEDIDTTETKIYTRFEDMRTIVGFD